ncbi:MAG: peptide chain release factor 1 [Spirochaetales bacterium]|jgi:peptide chain release factor 1|nr:peptide chain release factor 1 [Spirochaetales bacterium]
MTDKITACQSRFKELEILMADPDILKDQKRYREVLQEHAQLSGIMEIWGKMRAFEEELAGAESLAGNETDAALRELARDEARQLKKALEEKEAQLKTLLVPRDPRDGKNIIMEIRAGTGGEEAALFASDLFRMYSRYAEGRRWKVEILSVNETEIGGFKEIVFSVEGAAVYGDMKYEAGVHRVQRVPATEAGGRTHTSAVTVAVLPEAEENELDIRTEDLRIDTYRSSGAGGQHVNKTDSAVRITHIPTGLVVACQDERSQHKNRARAMSVLRSRLLEMEEEKKSAAETRARRSMVGSGDRSERIRTYNFPQNRLTDHRINLTLYRLDAVMEGDIGEVVGALKITDREERFKAEET